MALSPVPSVPNAERRTRAVLVGTVGPIPLGTAFPIYSFDEVQVYKDGVLVGAASYTLASAGATALPWTDAQVTFAAVQTGTIDVVGYRTPSTQDIFTEGGTSARSRNYAYSRVMAIAREHHDRLGRGVSVEVGETGLTLPAIADRASMVLGFDAAGDPIPVAPTINPTAVNRINIIDSTAGGRAIMAVPTAAAGEVIGRAIDAGAGNFGVLTRAQIIDIVSDYTDIENYYGVAGATTSGAATNITAQLNLAKVRGKKIRLRGFFDGTKKYFKVDPITFPAGTEIVVDGWVELVATSSTGILFGTPGQIKITGRLEINGGNASDTVLNGYVDGHIGLKIDSAIGGGAAGTDIEGVRLEGVKFKNIGMYGLWTEYLLEPYLKEVYAERIGYAGMMHHSISGGSQSGGLIKNIFPGARSGFLWQNNLGYTALSSFAYDATSNHTYYCLVNHTSAASGTFAADRAANPTYWRVFWERNAYGLSITQHDVGRQSVGFTTREVTIEDVPTWAGLDTHSSKAIDFIDCIVRNCSQGIAFEDHIASSTTNPSEISGCEVYGFGTGGTSTKDGLLAYSNFGIGVNASVPAGTAEGTRLIGNYTYGCGERRPGVQGGGAIYARFVRALIIEGNINRMAQQVGINLVGATATTDEILLATINGNIVDGVTAHASFQKGIMYGAYVQGSALGNQVNGTGSAANSYFRNGAATYGFSVGTVSGFGVAGDNWWS